MTLEVYNLDIKELDYLYACYLERLFRSNRDARKLAT